jgi:hypothetical protein
MTAWTNHCKQYAKANNCTYGEALQLARGSYQSGGKMNLRNVVRKGKNSVNRGSKIVRRGANQGANFLDKHNALISSIDGELGRNLSSVSQGLRGVEGVANQGVNATGGKMKLKNVVRKARNTTRRVTRTLDTVAPLVSLVNPEIGVPLMAANESVKAINGSGRGRVCKHCGAVGGQLAGSFKAIGGQTAGSFKTIGGGVRLGRSQSSILASTHNSFAVPFPKSLSRRLKEN